MTRTSDFLSQDVRTLRAQLKRISSAAKNTGCEAKVAGNKVVIDSRVYAANELSLVPKSIDEDLKQEKLVNGGIAYRGDRSIFSNFFPAPFNLGGNDYAHTEQYYQYHKAIHHKEDETAERILKLANPWRIKVLGDNIEDDQEWISKRMRVMYDANSAKFRQNWPLHDELLKTKGQKLYEATTDMYWACGVGYDSNRWSTMDWRGENVAGLIIMKVCDELLQESTGAGSENTLIDIACNTNDSMNMDTSRCPLESTLIKGDQHGRTEGSNNTASTNHDTHGRLYTDVIKSPGKAVYDSAHMYQKNSNTFGRRGAYGRGPTRSPRYRSNAAESGYQRVNSHSFGGGRRPYFHRGSPRQRRPYETVMSRSERDFLHGTSQNTSMLPDKDGYVTPRKTNKSPSSKQPNEKSPSYNKTGHSHLDVSNLTEHQKRGLVELGLIPDSAFVNNIVTASRKPAVNKN